MADVKVVIWGVITGLVVTDHYLYLRCMRITPLFRGLTMLLSAKVRGKIALERLKEISLGAPVFDMTTYCGHRLSINGKVVGALYLGSWLTFDDKLVENLETLFKTLV